MSLSARAAGNAAKKLYCISLGLSGCTNRPFYNIIVTEQKTRKFEGDTIEHVCTYAIFYSLNFYGLFCCSTNMQPVYVFFEILGINIVYLYYYVLFISLQNVANFSNLKYDITQVMGLMLHI